MSSEQPPPYAPNPQGGLMAPGFLPAFSSPPGTFPGSPYQTYPAQTYPGGEPSFYQGPPGHPGLSGPSMAQPGYPGYQSGTRGTHGSHGTHGTHGIRSQQPSNHWDSPYEQPHKQTVYLVGRNQGEADNSSGGLLSACSTALCCCCLWDMLSHYLQ